MDAWLMVATRDNLEKCKQHGVFGLNAKGQLGKVKAGDKLLAYVKGEKTIAGVGEITKEHFLDDLELFEGGLFPERIGIRLDVVPQEKALDVWEIVDRLAFPTDKFNWMGSLVGGFRRIPMADYELCSGLLAGRK